MRALRAIAEARQQLDENASPVLALEVMMLALPQLGAFNLILPSGQEQSIAQTRAGTG